jgi:hypothetical protein
MKTKRESRLQDFPFDAVLSKLEFKDGAEGNAAKRSDKVV